MVRFEKIEFGATDTLNSNEDALQTDLLDIGRGLRYV
jgi:hypothetical protein